MIRISTYNILIRRGLVAGTSRRQNFINVTHGKTGINKSVSYFYWYE